MRPCTWFMGRPVAIRICCWPGWMVSFTGNEVSPESAEEEAFGDGDALMAGVETLRNAEFDWLCLTVDPCHDQTFPWQPLISFYSSAGLPVSCCCWSIGCRGRF